MMLTQKGLFVKNMSIAEYYTAIDLLKQQNK